MTLQVLRRLAIWAMTLLVASAVIFVLLRVMPGDPARLILGMEAREDTLRALQQELGLDRPLVVQYIEWMAGVLQGDLGTSFLTREPVTPQVLEKLPVTIPLAVLALGIAIAIAVPAGVLAALRHRTRTDVTISAVSQVGMAIPAFWAGILLSTIVSVRLGWLPSGGFPGWEDPAGALQALILPGISLAIIYAAVLTRYVRSAVLEVMKEDYIRTAMAKGLRRRRALWRHAIRNASLPVVTVIGLQFGALVGGTIVIENVFYLPGLGRMIMDAIDQRDYVLVQGTALVLTAFVLIINAAVDALYLVIDPRLRGR